MSPVGVAVLPSQCLSFCLWTLVGTTEALKFISFSRSFESLHVKFLTKESLCILCSCILCPLRGSCSAPQPTHSWSPDVLCLPFNAHNPPCDSKNPAEAQSSRPSHPPIAHQPPPRPTQQSPKAQQPPIAHQHPPTPLWQLPSFHYRASQRTSPRVCNAESHAYHCPAF